MVPYDESNVLSEAPSATIPEVQCGLGTVWVDGLIMDFVSVCHEDASFPFSGHSEDTIFSSSLSSMPLGGGRRPRQQPHLRITVDSIEERG